MVKKQHLFTIRLIYVLRKYDHWSSHSSPKRKACLWVKISILRLFTGNGRDLTQNVDFSLQTGFTFWTAVGWPIVISSWHRYQFNCYKLLLLNHFTELDYHGYCRISHCLNLVDIFLFCTKWPPGFLKVCVFRNSFTVDQPNVGFSKTDAIIKCHTCSSDLLLKFCKNIQPIVHNHSLKTSENFWTHCILKNLKEFVLF